MKGQPYIVYNARETYHEAGEYDLKIVLNPSYFDNCHQATFEVMGPDRRPLESSVKRWGRKMICSFVIRPESAEGVAVARFSLIDRKGHVREGVISFWIVI